MALLSLGMGSSRADHQAGRLRYQAKHIAQIEKLCRGKIGSYFSRGQETAAILHTRAAVLVPVLASIYICGVAVFVG